MNEAETPSPYAQPLCGADALVLVDEFTFRFNRRTSVSRGKLFDRLLQHAAGIEPQPYRTLRGRKAPKHNTMRSIE